MTSQLATEPSATSAGPTPGRHRWLRRSALLSWATITWNVVESVVALALGTVAGSAALVGFGLDAAVEVAAATAALRRVAADDDPRAEHRAERLVAWAFAVLAVLVAGQSLASLASGEGPSVGVGVFVLTAAALVSSTLLALAKRQVARRLGSSALAAEARQTWLCAGQSAALLAGFAAAGAWGLWWMDAALGLAIAAVAAREAGNVLGPVGVATEPAE